MGIIRKYRFYKRLLRVAFFINGVFIVFGVFAAVKFFQTQDLSALNLAIIGAGALTFGFLIPWYLFERFFKVTAAIRKQTEQAVGKWITAILEIYTEKDDDILKDPKFWLKIVIILIEIFGEDTQHPALKMLFDLTPFLKQELRKRTQHT